MRKKWGIILGLTGRMLLALQSIYADSTTETTGEVNEKETADEKNSCTHWMQIPQRSIADALVMCR